MKISLNWLKDYVKIDVSTEKLAHLLTMAGLEVEKISKEGGDTVFELEITPNRPDCLNMLGMARETAAILNKSRKLPKVPVIKYPKAKCDIRIMDKEGCSRYIGTLIRDVNIAATPLWIQKRVGVLGMRTINNVVDITNFCLMETGQPLHAFDYDKLEGGKIVVRRARKGEKIVTIDDVERELDPSILVIADVRRPVAIAGIMGGKDTEVSAGTKNILLESAYFDPALIRRGARKVGLSSDSSYRFERGVDFEMVCGGANRAVALILAEAGGKTAGYSDVRAGKKRKAAASVRVSTASVNSLLGSDLTIGRMKKILKQLDFRVSGTVTLTVKPPSFRADVCREVDVIEEIARIIGYDRLPSSLPLVRATAVHQEEKREFRRRVRDLLLAQGYNEVITYTMVNQKMLEQTKQTNYRGIRIQNPLTQDQEMMRASFLPSLLPVVLENINRGQKDLRFFETGKVYMLGREREALGLIATGTVDNDWRRVPPKTVDYFDIKGVLEQTLRRLGVRRLQSQLSDQAYFEPGQSAMVTVDEEPVAALGKVNEGVLQNWGIKQRQDVFFAFVDLEKALAKISREKRYDPPSAYPAVVRDVSLAVKTHVHFQQIETTARRLGAGILSAVVFKELYLGKGIPAGSRGLVFSLSYQSQDRTLREEEVNAVHEKILQACVTEWGAAIR